MKHILAILALALLLIGTEAQAQRTRILGPGLGSGRTVFFQSGSRTLYADTVYTLTGLYFVPTGSYLNIQPGTVITGDTAATLIIQPGAKIHANGTPTKPIVFTSRKPTGQRAPGDWGGIVMLGSAPTNQINPVIEGGIIPGTYGGSVVDDSSGVMRYVRIEFPGYRFQLDNEVNGLTMGGVGRKTVIEYIQVSYSFDDSYEWFGGNVNARYLVAFGGTDDEFDGDFGWQGKVQFGFGMKDRNNWDPTGQTNGFEQDNESSASWKNPRTYPWFSNVTLIGPNRLDGQNVPPGSETRHQYAAVMRRGTMTSVYNSILMGYAGGYSLRDLPSLTAANGDTLQARNISLQVFPGTTYPPVHQSGTLSGFSADTWFNTPAYGNLGGTAPRNPSAIGLTDLSIFNSPNPVPTAGSEPAIAGTDFSGNLSDPFFTPVSYRGAFDPSLSWDQQWTAGWTNFDPQNTYYGQVSNTWNLVSLPQVPASLDPAVVFPDAVPSSVNGTLPSIYTPATSLTPGEGYWALFTNYQSIGITGSTISSASIVVPAANRWVLVGSTSAAKPLSALTSSVPGSIVAVWGWNGTTYTVPTQIEPGKAYWVFVNAACTLTIN